jgi:hypothetical protein
LEKAFEKIEKYQKVKDNIKIKRIESENRSKQFLLKEKKKFA